MAREPARPPLPESNASQLAGWWHEAELARDAGQLPRARRFLRWILAANPGEEEAWLELARLATGDRERFAYLRQAYVFHPESARVQLAMRQASDRHLRTQVNGLQARQGLPHCLPNLRGRVPPDGSRAPGRRFRASDPLLMAEKNPFWPIRVPSFLLRLDGAAWLAFLLPLAVYLATACRTVYNLDSAEFSAAVHVLGIVRATGYPLYLLLGKAFAILLPVGDVAFRLNVMSALCGAGTVVLLYHLARRLVGMRAAALAAALLFGFSYYFWAQAVVAEVYTLHTLLLCALLLLLLHWESRRADGLLAAASLLYGLSLGNHLSSILVAPGLVAFVLAVGGREVLAPRRLLVLACLFFAGLGVYAYLPLRYLATPAFNYAGHYDGAGQFVPLDLTRLENLWWLVSGQGFRELMLGYTPAETVAEVGATLHRLWGAFLGVGLLPGLVGAWAQGRRQPRILLLLGLTFVANVAFYTTYRVVDKASMFVPAYLIWAVWIAEGCAWIAGWLQEQRAGARTPSPAWTWLLVLLALAALLLNGPLVNVRDDTRARDRAEAILQSAGPECIVFGWWASAPPVQYLQLVEG
ncbi:MAG TPA: DUF2723 domain-containing protein, partial [Anaerolineae bacterium]|nr:DUF2723 domain-containing protein [Anaerolineae bacterium]